MGSRKVFVAFKFYARVFNYTIGVFKIFYAVFTEAVSEAAVVKAFAGKGDLYEAQTTVENEL